MSIASLAYNPALAATDSGLWNITKKVVNTYLNSSFGVEQNERFLRTFWQLKKTRSFNKAVSCAYQQSKLGESFWEALKDAFTPKNIKAEWEMAKGGVFKKSGAFLMKRMPFIQSAICLATELPNIFKAFTDTQNGGGIGTGLGETAKAAIKISAMAAGAALGTLVPVPGLNMVTCMAGGAAASWIADKLLGKSFTEKVKEAAEKKKTDSENQKNQNDTNMQNPEQFNPNGINNPFQYNPNNFSNPFDQEGWKDKDLMAMSVGLA